MAELRLPYLNMVLMTGRFVDDPHQLAGKDDAKGAAFTLAVNRWTKGKPTVTTFVDCISWGATAEAILASCSKGSPVQIAGSLGQYDKKSGKTITRKLQVSVHTAQFLARVETDSSS